MAAIDIGAAAIDRGNNYGPGTCVNEGNPANANGSITSVEIWALSNLSDCEVATFYFSGNSGSTRDYEAIGSVTSGSKQTFSGLDIDVQTGDYIGAYFSAGTIEMSASGGAGLWYKNATDYIPCTSQTFNHLSSYVISLYGEGETAGVTEKSSSDTGSGAEAKASGNPLATLVKAEAGSGSDVLSQVQAILDGAETGSGVDAVDSLETPEAKTSSDAGSGAEGTPAQSAILAGSESGSGIEALTSRLLAALDTGGGAEASSLETDGLLKDLFASELGEGSDRLVARIEMPTKGGGMKLWT